MSTPQLQRLHAHCHRLRLYRVEAELTTLLEQAAKLGSPVIALVLGVGWLTGDPPTLLAALVIAGLIVGYSLLWTGLHRSMHEVGGRWALHLPGYAALRAHHLDHHRHAGRNFGTVFGSLMDRICGTHT